MKKILNEVVKVLLKALLKIYKPDTEDRPMVVGTNVGQVLVEDVKGGGKQSWIPGHPFPFPGMPDEVVVETLAVFKRIFPLIYKWGWITLRDRLPNYLRSQSQNGDIGLVDPKKFSKPVREIHRIFTLMRSRDEEPEMKAKWTEMRDVLCLFFEYDDAYRFRLMDIINELDKSQFKFTPSDRYWADKKWRYNFSFKKNGNKTE